MSASKNVELPIVFLGSSRESLPELHIIEEALKPHAKVIPWTDGSFVAAGRYILDSLLQEANTFDFAVFIFGADDVTTSRNIQQASPRDNVIFETGLFMSYLGRERTLVVAPSGGPTPLKILSDFAGLKLVDYELPKDRANFWQALKPACDEIVKRIKELQRRSFTEASVQPGPRDAMDAGQTIRDLIERSLNERRIVTVHNIALDMEFTWPILKGILDRADLENLTWRSLMIEPTSEAIKGVASKTVDLAEARKSQDEIRETCEAIKAELETRQISFECRAYESVPLMHGFLVNDSVLLLTLCGISGDGRLVGRPNPYWKYYRNPDSTTTAHFFKVFEDWFSYHWDRGLKVWPL